MNEIKKRAAGLRRELGREITCQALEKKLELCGYKVLYYGDGAASKGDQMLELLDFKDDIIMRQAFTFPGGDGCDFVFVDTSLGEEACVLALLREWCHIRLEHPVTNRVLGLDFQSEQEAACLAEAIMHAERSRLTWSIAAGGALLIILAVLLVQMGRVSQSEVASSPAAAVTGSVWEEASVEDMPLADEDFVCISKEKFHRKTCTYATDVKITRAQAVKKGYGRCQICLP